MIDTSHSPPALYRQHIQSLGAGGVVSFDPDANQNVGREGQAARYRLLDAVRQCCRRYGRRVIVEWQIDPDKQDEAENPVVGGKLVLRVTVTAIDPDADRPSCAADRVTAAEIGDLQSRSRWHNWGGMAEGDSATLTVEDDRQLAAATASYMAFGRRYGVRFSRRTRRREDGRIEMTVTRVE